METSEKMFNWDEEWNISFAGCGFRSIYYLGALSCILQQVPQLVHGASKICGASSGCLVAAALTVGIPIEQFCVDVLTMAKEARKHTLGVFHPTFSLLRSVRDSLLEKLPADAHLRASGKLCVSLTRLADGKNVLVSEFDSREELIQVLMCSCFFPVYCGFIPPSYHGVLYMDGALSNNMPLFEHRNTITMAPFSGESDICPKEGTFNFFEVHYGNVSIQVNTGNVHRVCTSFLPPRLETLAEICHNGYMDAHRFLRERDLLGTQRLPPSLVMETDTVSACCELAAPAEESKKTLLNGQNPHQEDHRWLDLKVIENLPVSFKTGEEDRDLGINVFELINTTDMHLFNILRVTAMKQLQSYSRLLYHRAEGSVHLFIDDYIPYSHKHEPLIRRVPPSSIIVERRQTSLQLMSPKLCSSHQNNLDSTTMLCEACRDSHDGSKLLPVKVVMYLLTVLMLPIELTVTLAKSILSAICRLLTSAADLCRQKWINRGQDPSSAFPEQRCSSESSNSDLITHTGRNKNNKCLTSTKSPYSNRTHRDNNCNLDLFSFTSTSAGPSDLPTHKTPACGKMALNHRSKWTVHQA